MRLCIVLGLLTLMVLISGCIQQEELEEEGLEEVEYTYVDVTPAEAKDLIEKNLDLIIVDVSPKYAEGHIPNAVSYPLGDGSLDNAIPTLDVNKQYLVYCHTDAASIAGAQKLIDAGFSDVYRLKGNYAAWVAAGYEVEIPEADIVQTAISAGSFNTLVAAIQTAELVETLKGKGPFTVFAPTDEAFEKLPKEKLEALLEDKGALTSVLKYHVIPGKVMASDVVTFDSATTAQGEDIDVLFCRGGIFINDAKLIQTDIEASNGVIHVIDSVLLPETEIENKNIVRTAIDAGSFNTLVTAIQAANLVEQLECGGPFTVFAPTDESFAKVPEDMMNAILSDTERVTSVLKYHVVSGQLMASDIADLESITTEQGEEITINVTDEGVFVNDVKITQTDIETSNGVIHVIDSVLIPESEKEKGVIEMGVITSEELSKHNYKYDCWVGYEGKVYDITFWTPDSTRMHHDTHRFCGTSTPFEDNMKSKYPGVDISQQGILKGTL